MYVYQSYCCLFEKLFCSLWAKVQMIQYFISHRFLFILFWGKKNCHKKKVSETSLWKTDLRFRAGSSCSAFPISHGVISWLFYASTSCHFRAVPALKACFRSSFWPCGLHWHMKKICTVKSRAIHFHIQLKTVIHDFQEHLTDLAIEAMRMSGDKIARNRTENNTKDYI